MRDEEAFFGVSFEQADRAEAEYELAEIACAAADAFERYRASRSYENECLWFEACERLETATRGSALRKVKP